MLCCALWRQVEIYEFEKTELNSQEEMEKAARQYAEEQLAALQVECSGLVAARGQAAAQMAAMRVEFEGIQAEAAAQHDAMRAEAAALNNTIVQVTAVAWRVRKGGSGAGLRARVHVCMRAWGGCLCKTSASSADCCTAAAAPRACCCARLPPRSCRPSATPCWTGSTCLTCS